MKMDPYCQQQKCRPMILVSGRARCTGIFAGLLLAGASNESGVDDDGNFGDLSGYFFGIFRDKASSIIWRHATLVNR